MQVLGDYLHCSIINIFRINFDFYFRYRKDHDIFLLEDRNTNPKKPIQYF